MPNNPPAFPSGAIHKARERANDPGSDFYISNRIEPKNVGMTLRDYFAAHIIQGICAVDPNPAWSKKMLAQEAYDIANEMLEVRKQYDQ